jgi:hypothetical protein
VTSDSLREVVNCFAGTMKNQRNKIILFKKSCELFSANKATNINQLITLRKPRHEVVYCGTNALKMYLRSSKYESGPG